MRRKDPNDPKRKKPFRNKMKAFIKRLFGPFTADVKSPDPFPDKRHDHYLHAYARRARRANWSKVHPVKKYPFDAEDYHGSN